MHARLIKKIGEILVEQGCLTQEQRASVLELLPGAGGKRFGELCVAEKLITEDELAAALAQQLGLQCEDFVGFTLDDELMSRVPVDALHRYKFIPLEDDQAVMTIAVSDPTDVIRLDELELLLDRRIRVRVASETAVQEILKRGGTARTMLREVSENFILQLVRENDSGEEILSAESASSDAGPIVKLINTILMDALHRRASDIHIETAREGVVIKYRIDGVLFQANDVIAAHFQAPIISRLKVMSELDIAERRIPQDGRFKVRIGGRSIDFRVSIMPSVLGEDAVLRILDKESIANDLSGLSFETLGMHPREMRKLRKKIREPYGMVLVTGPTGSGKTTTLYAALTEIHTGEEKIVTIEDPVEYMLPGILQIPVKTRFELATSTLARLQKILH